MDGETRKNRTKFVGAETRGGETIKHLTEQCESLKLVFCFAILLATICKNFFGYPQRKSSRFPASLHPIDFLCAYFQQQKLFFSPTVVSFISS